MASEESKHPRVIVGAGDPNQEGAQQVDLDQLDEQGVLNMLLLMLGQNMERAGLEDGFVLLIRKRNGGKRGLITTITDVPEVMRALKSALRNVPEAEDVPSEALCLEDILPKKN